MCRMFFFEIQLFFGAILPFFCKSSQSQGLKPAILLGWTSENLFPSLGSLIPISQTLLKLKRLTIVHKLIDWLETNILMFRCYSSFFSKLGNEQVPFYNQLFGHITRRNRACWSALIWFFCYVMGTDFTIPTF